MRIIIQQKFTIEMNREELEQLHYLLDEKLKVLDVNHKDYAPLNDIDICIRNALEADY